jgi:two-component system LytT family sensor kinase
MPEPLTFRLTRRTWLATLLVFGLLGLIESTRDILGRRDLGQSIPIWTGLLGNMPWWLLWALLLPVALGLVTRFPLNSPFQFRSLAAHLVAGTALSMGHGLLNGALYWVVMTPYRINEVPMTAAMVNIANRYLFMNLLTYGGLVGAAHALAFAARLREREVTAARLEQAVTAARLDALRMELNPHFLFNTLNAISGLVVNAERDAAVRMLARLGDLLRMTLNRDAAHLVSLRRELELVQLHLEIEQVRFRDRLTVRIEPDPATLDTPVPTLILQPLVENAIRHGVAPVPGAGRVVVRSRREGGRVVLEVEDSGSGFAPGQAERGVGLANVRARLNELYGTVASLEFRATDTGFVAAITLDPAAAAPIDAELDG